MSGTWRIALYLLSTVSCRTANRLKLLLHAMVSCLTTSIVAQGAVRGIDFESLQSELEGDLDLSGFLGLSPEMTLGFTDINVKFKVKAKPEDIDTVKSLTDFSPVSNTLVKGVPANVAAQAK